MNCHRHNRSNLRSVTLMELLVASVILSICLLGAYQASRSALSASDRMDRYSQADQQVRSVFEALGRDLRCAVVAEGQPSMSFTGQNGEEGGALACATLSGDGTAWHPGARPALRRAAYSASGGNLIRSETALSGPGGSHTSTLASGVGQLAFQFYQGANPVGEWDSDRELPTAVDIALVVNGVSYHTLLRLPAGKEAGE